MMQGATPSPVRRTIARGGWRSLLAASVLALLAGCGSSSAAEGPSGTSTANGGGPSGTGSGGGVGTGGGGTGGAVSVGGGGGSGGGEGGGAEVCGPDRQPPPGMTRAQSCILGPPDPDCTDWASLFGDVPGTTGIRHFAVSRDQYLAVALETPEGVRDDANITIGVDGLQAWPVLKGPMLWSISRCPGDFNVEAITEELEEDCVKGGPLAGAGFRLGGADALDPSDPRCALSLPAGTTYYLNLLFTADDPAVTPNVDLTWECPPHPMDPDYGMCGFQMQLGSILW